MSSSDQIDHHLIRKLAKLLSETDLNEIEIEHETFRIRLSRSPAPIQTVVHAAPQPLVQHQPPVAVAAPADAPLAAPPASNLNALKSPMVGTAYLSPEPGTPPFVSVGDSVKTGQTVLIIEAMKTMNQIPAERDGKVVAILINDAQPVEYGEPLIVIE
ncbi:MAG: acetyl-CoA carboxylase biotin carboxyl carrier protein [Rhizobiales bacterium]|nr:acetyl-CoA carboxylase biotin carboxyl carrier protein [Hyphomicrobiales bacterium]